MAENEFDKNVMFANWNNYYNDIANNIQRATLAGTICMVEPEKIHDYYSLIVNMFYTYKFALEKVEVMEKKLIEVETKIFRQDFITKAKSDKLELIRVLRVLRKIFSKMMEDFSNSGLIPKIKKTRKYNPNEAILG